MGLFKNIRENGATSPKTTKKGVKYSLFMAVASILLVELGKTHPEIAQIIEPNLPTIYSGIALLATTIIGWFAGKKDR